MKRKLRYSLALAMVFTLVSCFEQPVTTVPATTTTTGGGGFGTTDDGGTTDPGGGTTSGGGGLSVPWVWNVTMGGHVDWYPRNTSESAASNCNHPSCGTPGYPACYSAAQCKSANEILRQRSIPTVLDAANVLTTDSRYKVRITVNPKPIPDSGHNSGLEDKIYCFRRLYPGMPGPNYTSLSFKVVLNYINSNNTLGSEIWSTEQTRTVNVGSSTIIDFSHSRPPSSQPFAFRIRDVRNQNGDKIRSYDCWSMKVEVSTDYFQDF